MPKTGERQIPALEITEWLGMFTNTDPHDLPPGAALEQVNVTSIKRGMLETRGGTREVSFDN